MAWKLIYTSAPRLLQAGRSGFGTVARHREIPPLVAETAEKSSQFSRQTGLDSSRVIFAYRLARSSAGTFHLLTRISDAGTDYSGRTNHLAEHLILTDQEASRLGAESYTPAGVMLAYEWAGYEGQARWLGDEDLWHPSATDANTGGSHWQEATADPNKAYLLASAEAQSGAVLEYPSHYQTEAHPWILWLFAESQCLCSQSGWGITFTTNVQPTDSLSDFRWLGVPEDSPVLKKLQASGRPLFSFATEAPKTFARAPNAQEPTLFSAHEGTVRSSESSAPGLDTVKAASPPKEPVAVKKPAKSFWLLCLLLSVAIVVFLTAAAWWFFSTDVPAPLVSSTPPDVSAQAKPEEPQVTSIPPEKASELDVKKSDKEETAAGENKLIGTEKISEPPSGSTPGLTSEQKPVAAAPPQVRPSKTLILFPQDSWEKLNWPDAWTSENLRIAMIDKSGKQQILKAPGRFESGGVYETDSGVPVFRAAGLKKLPTERTKNDAYIFEVSSTKSPNETWRIYVLPDNKSLQSVVASDDSLMLSSFVISAGVESSLLQFDTTDLVLAEFLSYIRDQSSIDTDLPSLVLEASYSEPESIHSARMQQMIDSSTAGSLRPLRIPIDDKGQLIIEEANKPFSDLTKQMEQLRSSASNKPSDILSELRGSLLASLRKIAKAMDNNSSSAEAQSLFPDGKLTEIPQNLKSEELESQLQKLTDQYFNSLDALLPKGDKTKLQEHRRQTLEHIQNKKYQDAGKSAGLFIDEKRRVSGQDSFALRSESKALGSALNQFVQRSSNAVCDYQRELAGKVIEELPQSLPHLFLIPPQVPDLSYTLKIRRGSTAGKPDYVIAENIRVIRADDSQVNPAP